MEFSNDYENTLDRDRRSIQTDMSHIGVSTHPGKHQLGELRATISTGAKHIELGWFGTGKGNIGQGTMNPETHSSEEREAMRELAKINQVSLSTHASPNAGYLSGLGERGFSKQAQEATKHEIDRAIGFAADVAQGGPVVVHVGEFQRPIFEVEKRFNSPDEFFEGTAEEKKKAQIVFVDKDTGNLKALPREMMIHEETGETDERGLPKYKETPVYKLIEEGKEPVTIFKELMQKEKDLALGEAGRAAAEARLLKEKAKGERELAEEVAKGNEEAIEAAKLTLANLGIPPRGDIKEKLNKVAAAHEGEATHYSQIAGAKTRELKNIEKQTENTETIYDYGRRESANAIADEAVKAYRIEKERKLEKPLWIALENWDPNLYGSHPKELRELIHAARDQMTKRLKVEQNMNESQAAKVAEDHIKATFDIGHANFWRKYFKRDPNISAEEHETKFKKWLMDNVRELTKEGIIGHVHLSDNFGWHDEHLTPGLGNAPIQDFVKEVTEGKEWKGKMVVERGGQPPGLEYTGITGTWRALNTPIYRIDAAPTSWTEIENSYFANVGPATVHVVGEYVPFKDWSSWSTEIPLE